MGGRPSRRADGRRDVPRAPGLGVCPASRTGKSQMASCRGPARPTRCWLGHCQDARKPHPRRTTRMSLALVKGRQCEPMLVCVLMEPPPDAGSKPRVLLRLWRVPSRLPIANGAVANHGFLLKTCTVMCACPAVNFLLMLRPEWRELLVANSNSNGTSRISAMRCPSLTEHDCFAPRTKAVHECLTAPRTSSYLRHRVATLAYECPQRVTGLQTASCVLPTRVCVVDWLTAYPKDLSIIDDISGNG